VVIKHFNVRCKVSFVEYQVRPALPVPLTVCHGEIMIDDLNV